MENSKPNGVSSQVQIRELPLDEILGVAGGAAPKDDRPQVLTMDIALEMFQEDLRKTWR